jgi:hypothetical protein
MLILDLRLLIRSNFAVQWVMEVRTWPQLNRLQVITGVTGLSCASRHWP